jgi:CHASE2 domain-containing sensor protein
MTLPRGMRAAALAVLAAAVVLFVFATFADTPVIRGLETASLDLRFRLRGPRPPGPAATVIVVDDRSLAVLGRWPLPRTTFARAVRLLHRAGAKIIVFDLLFAEPDEPLSADLRAAARRAAGGLAEGRGEELRAALERLGDSDRDGDLAAAMGEAGNVLLPVGFAFTGAPSEAPSWLSDAAYARFDKSPLEPSFPLRPVSAVPPIEKLAAAAAGLGHTSVAYDLDGEPRYDYAALPFEADFLPSLPVRAAAAWLGVPWPQVALALGEGVRLGDEVVPTDPAMRLLINYRGPRGTFPTFSFVDLLDGQVPAAALAGHVVLVGASFLGASDSFAAPFGSTQLPGVERMANIIDTITERDFITEIPAEWKLAVAVAILSLAALTGGLTEILPTRFAVLAGAAPLAGWFGAAQWAFVGGL